MKPSLKDEAVLERSLPPPGSMVPGDYDDRFVRK
jgi:hypothetical protein